MPFHLKRARMNGGGHFKTILILKELCIKK